jgi:hypothetical protein
MIDLGLTSGQKVDYRNALVNSHQMRTTVRLLEMDHTVVQIFNTGNLSVLDGAVTFDESEHVSRALSLDVFDPGKLATANIAIPTADTLWANRMIQVKIGTYVPEMAAWVDCPIFTGPITKVDPDGYIVHIEAHGKERLLQPPNRYWRTHSFPRKHLIVNVMRRILNNMGEGDAHIDLPAATRIFQHHFNMLGVWSPWPVLKELAEELDRQIYYDGAGMLRVRAIPQATAYTFEYGKELLTVPQLPFDFIPIRNIVQVRGKRPESGRRPIAQSTATGTNIAPTFLGRNGTGRFIVHIAETDHIDKKSDAKSKADDLLAAEGIESADLEFESMVVPWLEEQDQVTILTDIQSFTFRMRKWSIPLTVHGTMSIGFHKKYHIVKKRRMHGHLHNPVRWPHHHNAIDDHSKLKLPDGGRH